MLQVEEQELQGVDRLFVSRLLEQLAKQLNLNHDLLQQLEASVLTRIVAPRRTEIQGHLHGDRLRQENRDMVIALRTALGSVPRQLLDDAILRWRESQIMLTMQAMREVLLRLELRLGDNQLGQVYTGCINLLDRAVIKSQAIPINWEGFRYRLIFAAGDDLTPRGHLNYFCNCAAKVMEALLHRGYEQKVLRNLLETSIQQGVELVAIHRQEYFSRQIQDAVHEMGDSLSNIMRVVEEVIKNVAAAVTVEGERKERLVHGINGFRTRRAKLIRNLAQVESSGVPLPTGLRERLQEVVVLAKDLLSSRDTLADHPERFVAIAQGIKHIKRKAQAVSFEFRRVRRKSEALLRRNLIQLGGEEAEDALGSIEGHQQRVLVEAAQALIWSYQDASYALELHNLAQQVELMRMKAAMLDEKVSSGVIGQLEATLRRNPFDVFRFRMAGKRMLAMVMDVLRPVPINLIASHEEEEIWAAVADLSDACQRFSRLIEGEEAERLEELPEVLQELQQSVGRIRQDKVLTIPITPALDREKKCQNGELRLSIAERLENLNAPLRDLVRVSLTIGRGDSHFLVARQRAMHTLGVTRDSEPERGNNHLAELTVVPLVRIFQPCDPRYGRRQSELERRLLRSPIPGLLPAALLFGVRRPNSLENLGRLEEAADRERRALQLVNRSGLLGTEVGLHPLWDEIVESDDAQMLATEMRPLFSGNAGQGFLARAVADNPEYDEYFRLDEEERITEANLLLEALTNRNGFLQVQQVVFELSRMLAEKEFADQLQDRREFMLNQRDVFSRLGVEDPLEQLKPVEAWNSPGALEDLEGPLTELSQREQEIVLLQLYHRRLLQTRLLGLWVQKRYSSQEAMIGQAPGLVSEILERYHWLLRQGGTPGEREEVAELLNSLDMEAARLGVEEGVVLLAKVRQKVLRYRVMKSDSQVTLTGRFLSILRGGSLPVRQLEKELREHFARLRWLGLARDATFMEQEMNQPLEEEQE